ncbi:anaerobic ribonucleoside-triphosphate reductase activating protein [Ramlibacter alkalitolerans]|uniref:anaerobic ribonucleoside-triphosphate reductase activating protein n=1 Tax=Ramlibacter alkalitolerans TaxID=2039631 RepID=UPI001F3C0927|nr:anaerobic ribonucleoside-triphosphate reductase activating protein [Ramlibacter alkalitolerans]
MSNAADARGAARLRVGGLQRWTSIDFPGRLAAVVFCQGCPWRCSYCHNPELLDASAQPQIAWEEVLDFLRGRCGLLDGVVFSGGEPLLQTALPAAMQEVRALGFEVGLHTSGMYPDRLAQVLPLVDWIGLDIKAPWQRLDTVTASRGGAARVLESLLRVLLSGVAHECRTTWSPELFPLHELHDLAEELAGLGVRRWALQQCRGGSLPDPARWRAELALFAARFEDFEFRAA